MGNHAHRIQKLAAEKLHAHDSLACVHLEVFLQQEQVIGEPQLRTLIQQPHQFRRGVQQEHARTAAALLGL